MPDNWINKRELTSEEGVWDSEGNKVHDLIDISGEVIIDPATHPILASRLGDLTIPAMTTPTNSPVGYKVVADAT